MLESRIEGDYRVLYRDGEEVHRMLTDDAFATKYIDAAVMRKVVYLGKDHVDSLRMDSNILDDSILGPELNAYTEGVLDALGVYGSRTRMVLSAKTFEAACVNPLWYAPD